MALTNEELYYFRQALKKDDREIRGRVKLMYSGGSFNSSDNIRATATGSDEDADVSHPEQVIDNNDIRYNFAGLENDYFIADGSMELPVKEKDDLINNGIGYVGEIGKDTFTIEMGDEAYPEIWDFGITIYFSENGEYAIDFDVTFTVYDSLTGETFDETVNITNNDKNSLFVYRKGNSSEFNSFKKIVINVKSWSNPNHRVRISKVEYGRTAMLNEDEISSFTVLKQIDLTNYSSPTDEFTLSIDNYSGDYNFPEERNNLLIGTTLGIPYIGANTDIGFKYLPLGTYVYTEITNDTSSMSKLTFKGCFEKMAEKGMSVTSQKNLTPDEIIKHGFSNSNYNVGTLDLDYNEVISNPQNVNFTNLREQMQGLSQYTGSFMKQEPVYPEIDTLYYEPTISFFSLNDSRYEDELTLRNMQGYPVIKFGKGISNIEFSYESIGDKNTDKKEVVFETTMYGEEVILDNEDMYGYFINSPTNSAYDKSSLEVYGNGTKYDNSEVLQESGLFNISLTIFSTEPSLTIQAKAYTYDTNRNTSTIENFDISGGDKMTINNGYITTAYYRRRVADEIFSRYFDEFDISTFGDPTLECGDFILFEIKGGQKKGFIEEIEIDYNGGLSGRLKGVCSDV